MTLALLTSRSMRPSLLVLGAVVAPLLAGLGLFGLGDAELTARAKLEREARARALGVQSQWAARLADEAPAARALGALIALTQNVAPLTSGPIAALTETERAAATRARLLLLSARAGFGAGEPVGAITQCQRAIETSEAMAGEALLLLTQIASLSEGSSTSMSDLYRDAVDAVPYDAALDGTAARLLALLTAAPSLDPPTRMKSSRALAAALQEGRAPLPEPGGDRIELTPAGWRLEPDPWWAALQSACEERLGGADIHWNAAFQLEARRSAGVTAYLGARFPGDVARLEAKRWTLLGDDEIQVAVRPDGAGTVLVAVHTAATLDGVLQSFLPSGDDFEASAFGPIDQNTALVAPVPLAGTPALLNLAVRPGSGTLRAVTLRIQALRAGLIAVAALLALAAFAGWRALSREERLRNLRSTFVASVSHDLRTPVASISLLASNLASGYAAGSEAKYLDSIQGEAARLRRLVDDLLDFGRLERGLPPRIRPESVELLPWLGIFAEQERKRCHALGCALDLVTEALPVAANLDAPALERGLSNLIDNAIKHGRATSATLCVRGAGSMLIFEVEDSGSGLSVAALRADLFQPFERGSAKAAGTGLGLSIVRAIAEGHDGTAKLRAGEAGVGAIATIEIPIGGDRAA